MRESWGSKHAGRLRDVVERAAEQAVTAVARLAASGATVPDEERAALVERATVACLRPNVRDDPDAWRDRAVTRIAVELVDYASRVRPAATMAVPDPRFTAGPVLIVEDSPTAAELIKAALAELGLRNPLAVADTIAAARAELSTGPRPALVLLDYELPDGFGIELLHDASLRPRLESVPVVMLSAHSGADAIRASHLAGVTAYLVKPVAFDAVRQIVRDLNAPWQLVVEERDEW